MALSVNNNIASLQTDRQLAKKTDELKKNFAKLSSGLRINSASDDAAGLAIATGLLANASINDVGVRNVSDAISAVNIAEGSVSSASDIVARLSELATQASNGTLSSTQRTALNQEFQSLRGELDRISQTTEFNGQQLLNGSTTIDVQAGADSTGNAQLSVSFPGVSASSLGLNTDISTQGNALQALDEAKNAVNSLASARGDIGSSVSRFDVAIENLRSSSTNARDAASQIRDADIADTSAKLTAAKIGQNVAAAVKAQANLDPQIVLRLLSS